MARTSRTSASHWGCAAVRFARYLEARGYPSMDMQVAVLPDEFHATVAPTVLSHGLLRFFSGF